MTHHRLKIIKLLNLKKGPEYDVVDEFFDIFIAFIEFCYLPTEQALLKQRNT